MPQVAIPATHFTHSVKKNYQEHKSALIREFVQNSVDAGATNITFRFVEDERCLIVEDNGCGMSRDILVNALLTMSGSYKGANSIGGFGAAKEILLFQHHEYRVTTRKDGITTTVIGNQLDYEFVDGFGGLEQDGTVFTILFHQDYDLDDFQRKAQSFLMDCETDAKIVWNDIEVTPLSERGEFIDKNLDWAKIYIKKAAYEQYSASVRINGVKMFDAYINKSQWHIVVEVTKPSLEILTVNRDGFVNKYQRDLSALIYEISVDKGQFGKAYDEHKVWQGDNKSYDDVDLDFDCVLEHVDDKFGEYEARMVREAIKEVAVAAQERTSQANGLKTKEALEKVVEIVREEAHERNIPYELIDRMVDRTNSMVCDHAADFYIKVTGKGFDKIPDNLRPGKWGKRTANWARLWKHCLKLVMQTNAVDVPYAIGWVIDHDEKTQAMHTQVDGIHVFYMNPMLTWMRSSNHANVFHKMLMNACHEVAHMKYTYHDESFILCYEDMLHRALCHMNKTKNSWWREYMASKHEII